METILKLTNVTSSYCGEAAIKNINLTLPKNHITAVIGPSGCGKSTLLRTINRMLEEEPDTSINGEILLAGIPTDTIDRSELRRQIGMVFQSPAPFPFSIYKNITYAPKYYGIHDKQKLSQIVREKLELTGLYEEVKDILHKSALQLSGGQQQRLCIARALTAEPHILLLDEPCSALDIKSRNCIEKTLLALKMDYTIILVTHNVAQAKRLADYTVFMDHGNIIEFSETSKLFSAPAHLETKNFLDVLYD